VHWSLCIVGRTRATLRLIVIFLSPNTGSRQAVKEQIKSSRILKSYPRFITIDYNHPLGYTKIVSLGKSNNNIDTTTFDTDPTSHRYITINCLRKAEGAVVIYTAHNGVDTRKQIRAMARGIL
jgi:hypothetical protein